MDIDADGGDHEAAGPAECGDDAGSARSDALEPTAPDGGRDAEQDEEQGVHPAQVELGPVAARREQGPAGDGELAEEGGGVAGAWNRLAGAGRHPKCAAERQPEHAEAVGHADAEMDGERGGRHEPAVIARARDDAFFVEQADSVVGSLCACSSRHCFSPQEDRALYGPFICQQFERAWRRPQGPWRGNGSHVDSFGGCDARSRESGP